MMARDLVALVPGAQPANLPKGLQATTAGGYTAIYGAARLSRAALSRRKMLKEVVRRQQWLEELMGARPIVPVLPQTFLSPAKTHTLVAGNTPLLDRLAQDLQGMVQYQLDIRWDIDAAPVRFGCPDAAALEAVAAQLRAEMGALVTARDRIDLPREGDGLWNTVLLVDASDTLDPALEAIDAMWTEGLRLRLVGPSPAVSFASLHLRHVSAAEVLAARTLMSFSTLPDSEPVLAERRKDLLMTTPAEARSGVKDAARILAAAIRTDGAPPILADIWREGRAATDMVQRSAA